MNYKLYLDDIRNPKTSGWIIVRSYNDAIDIIIRKGIPIEMSLDHDLGENSLSGYDFIKWFYYRAINCEANTYEVLNTKVNVHSANPVGTKSMIDFMTSAKKFLLWRISNE